MVPILSGLFDTLLVVVLMFFLLYGRNDLRDRLVRLAARGRITLSAEAIGGPRAKQSVITCCYSH